VNTASELSEFLTSRRAKVTPEQAGLRSYGRRQVPGLRREEVASLAGVSVEYYKRLERGNAAGVSDEVLGALAQALQLDDAERAPVRPCPRGQPGSVEAEPPWQRAAGPARSCSASSARSALQRPSATCAATF